MKTIKRVYAGTIRYHDAEAFRTSLPAQDQLEEGRCNTTHSTDRPADLAEADIFGELIWKE